jgi:hypothetical protein
LKRSADSKSQTRKRSVSNGKVKGTKLKKTKGKVRKDSKSAEKRSRSKTRNNGNIMARSVQEVAKYTEDSSNVLNDPNFALTGMSNMGIATALLQSKNS